MRPQAAPRRGRATARARFRPTRPSREPARSGWSACGPSRSNEHDLAFDWTWEGDETEEESKIRAEARKILELSELPISATTVRVPVLVGHAQSVWVETEEPLPPEQAEAVLAGAPGVRLVETPTPLAAAETDEVLVGRIRPDRAADGNGLLFFLACDNLVKGAALNALQIAELLLEPARATAR